LFERIRDQLANGLPRLERGRHQLRS
jgi:hypothetical protein